jgi:hypothetical protein
LRPAGDGLPNAGDWVALTAPEALASAVEAIG